MGGFLDAFARGAAGPGLLAVGQMQQRNQELDRIREERTAERADAKAFQIELTKLNETLRREGNLWNVREGAEAALPGQRAAAEQAAAVALDARTKAIPVAAKEADSTAEALRRATVAAGGDKAFLQATAAIKLADPAVAAQIAAAKAALSESYARTGMLGTEHEAKKLDLDDKKKLGTLYDEAGAILSDAALSDDERAKKLNKVQTQIGLIKSKTGTGGATNPEKDTVKITDEEPTPSGGVRKTERTEIRRPGGGAPAPGPAAPPQAAVDYLLKNPNLTAEFDAKYGKGAAAKALAGAPTPKPAPAAPAAAPAAPAGGGMLSQGETPEALRGLSDIALRRIADDPSHPLQKEAAAELARKRSGYNDIIQRQMDDAAAGYGGGG